VKKIFLSAIATVALSATAFAADLPAQTYTKAPVVVPPPAFSWTGFYVGVNAGGHWSRDSDPAAITANNYYIPANVAIMNAALPTTMNRSGFGGGGQIGYNWQLSNFVVGVEADIMGLSGTASRAVVVPWNVPTEQATLNDSAQDKWMATFRARAGWAFDRFLVFGTGGAAVANWSISHSYSDNFLVPPTPLTTTAVNTNRTGWTAGGGVEYAVTDNWTVRAEYLYADFGTVNSNLTFVNPPLGTGATFGHADHLTEQVARAAVSYKFGGPIVARY
jgi:outer membrane immunogenic protein